MTEAEITMRRQADLRRRHSRSAWSISRTPNSAPACARSPARIGLPMRGARPMAEAAREAWITGIGIVSCLGEGPEAHWQALMRGQPQRRRDDASRPTSCIRSRRSISTSRSRKRATSARWSRGSASAPTPPASRSTAPASRATPNPVAHGHDRRRRRRRARPRRRHRDPVAACRGAAESGRLPQRTADERPAPDAVPGAALQPARRQHLDRARRHRLLAHLHGRGSRPASTRCASRSRASTPGRATSRWSAAPTTASGPTC